MMQTALKRVGNATWPILLQDVGDELLWHSWSTVPCMQTMSAAKTSQSWLLSTSF